MNASEVLPSQACNLAKAPIEKLSDELLAKIFAKVEPLERLHLLEVCSTWNRVAGISWTDIKALDLSSIPAKNVGAVFRLCPNLEKITGRDQKIILEDVIKAFNTTKTDCARVDTMAARGTSLAASNGDTLVCGSIDSRSIEEQHPSRSIVRSVSFYNTELACAKENPGIGHQMRQFIDRFPRMEELVLHNIKPACFKEIPRVVADINEGRWFPASFGASLRRLQITGDATGIGVDGDLLSAAFTGLPDLECLIIGVDATMDPSDPTTNYPKLRQAFGSLTNLRELCVTHLDDVDCTMPFGRFGGPLRWNWLVDVICTKLSKLEVLFMANMLFCYNDDCLAKLMTTHPSLRIMGLSGSPFIFPVISLPKRELYPNGPTADPVPFLHLFVGNQYARKIRFTTTSPNAVQVHPITSPLPEFLAQPDVAEIFKDVWLAEKIRGMTLVGGKLWEYAPDFAPAAVSSDEED